MSVCDVPIISSVCDVAGEAAATVVAAPFDWLAQAMGGAAGWLIEAMWAVFDTTTLLVRYCEYLSHSCVRSQSCRAAQYQQMALALATRYGQGVFAI